MVGLRKMVYLLLRFVGIVCVYFISVLVLIVIYLEKLFG